MTSMAKHPQNQKGSVLVISLVIMTVLALLGISSVDGSLLGEKMAANSHASTVRFNVGQSELEAQVDNIENDPYLLDNARELEIDLTAETSYDSMAIGAKLFSTDKGICLTTNPNYINSSGNDLIGVLTVSATVSGTNAQTTQIQGMCFRQPSS